MPGRSYTGEDYRYGFQGQETDKEWLGGAVAFKYRVHDARIGRFLSVDPLTADYPNYSSYSFSGNRVIDSSELEGLEPENMHVSEGEHYNQMTFEFLEIFKPVLELFDDNAPCMQITVQKKRRYLNRTLSKWRSKPII